MNVTTEQLISDRDRVFADWAETVTVKQVEQSFDPSSQQISAAESEQDVTAIVGAQSTLNVADAGGQLQSVDLVLQVKSEDWAASPGDVTWRAEVRGQTYDVVDLLVSPEAQVVELSCRKVADL